MPTRLSTQNQCQTTQVFTLADGSEMALVVRPPTYREVLHERSLVFMGLSAQVRYRIETVLTGWKDVLDEEDKPIEFSLDRFAELCRQHADLYMKAADIVSRFFFMDGAEQKN